MRRGNELRAQGREAEALPMFRRAHDTGPSPKTAAQLGLCEFALSMFVDAQEHLSEALKAPKNPWVKKYRAELEKALESVRPHVGRVEIIGDPPGADVLVNGRQRGTLPLGEPVFVNEGNVDVELRATGYNAAQRSLHVGGGRLESVVIRLQPKQEERRTVEPPALAATPASSGADASPGVDLRAGRSEPDERPFYTRPWVLGVAGAVVVGAVVAGVLIATSGAEAPKPAAGDVFP